MTDSERPAAPVPRWLRALDASGLSWPLIVACLACWLIYGLTAKFPMVRDGDTHWHLAAGRWILTHGAIPQTDPFSASMPGVAWTAHEWLAEVVMVWVHEHSGWAGLAAMATLAFAATLALLTRFLLQRMQALHALLFAGLAAGLMLSHVMARPHILAWPLMVLWFAQLVNAVEQKRAPPWWLLAVMLMWANLHGSFVLGVVFAFALAAEAVWQGQPELRRAIVRMWLPFLLLTFVASCLTPHHWEGWFFTFYVMSMGQALQSIGEWQSPSFHEPNAMMTWLLLVLALAMAGRFRLPLFRAALVLGLIYLALKHQRNIALLGILSPLFIARPLSTQLSLSGQADAQNLDRLFALLARPARGVTIGVFLLATVAWMAWFGQRNPHLPRDTVAPAAALKAARHAKVQGNVLNEYLFGGYLIHEGVPVFIDGRADMYGDAFLVRYRNAVNAADSTSLPTLLRDYRIGWTFLRPGQSAIAVLDLMPGWRRIHTDENAVVHMRVETLAKPRP